MGGVTMNLFKTKDKQEETKSAEVNTETKTQRQIKKIHGAFYSETQRLYDDAQQMNEIKTQKQDVIDKAKRLERLGFTNTKEVAEARQEKERLQLKENENARKQEVIDAINYFSVKYPQYKFITEDSVKRICKDYGLIYGPIDLYTGTVPYKNLKQLEEFEIKDEDKVYEEIRELMGLGLSSENKEYVDYEQYLRIDKEEREKAEAIGDSRIDIQTRRAIAERQAMGKTYAQQAPLEIAASSNDFNLKQMDTKDFKIVNKPIPDPVVLQPVMYNGNKYYLVVTAWGDEAEDSEVLNEKNN